MTGICKRLKDILTKMLKKNKNIAEDESERIIECDTTDKVHFTRK